MIILEKPATREEINKIRKDFGNYIKITADIEKSIAVAGVELHADGEKILLEMGSKQENIWGGGIDLENKIIDSTAVLNIRPRFGNDSMDILDPEKREKFYKLVRTIFRELWI